MRAVLPQKNEDDRIIRRSSGENRRQQRLSPATKASTPALVRTKLTLRPRWQNIGNRPSPALKHIATRVEQICVATLL